MPQLFENPDSWSTKVQLLKIGCQRSTQIFTRLLLLFKIFSNFLSTNRLLRSKGFLRVYKLRGVIWKLLYTQKWGDWKYTHGLTRNSLRNLAWMSAWLPCRIDFGTHPTGNLYAVRYRQATGMTVAERRHSNLLLPVSSPECMREDIVLTCSIEIPLHINDI